MQCRNKSSKHQLPLRHLKQRCWHVTLFNVSIPMEYGSSSATGWPRSLVLTNFKEGHSRSSSLHDFVHVISQHSTNYKLDDTMCYWYTSIIVEIAKLKFNCSEPEPPPPGRFQSIDKIDRTKWQENLKSIGGQIHESSDGEPRPRFTVC